MMCVAPRTCPSGEVARAKLVVGDPSYFPDKVRCVGKVVRAIAIMVREREG